MNRKLRNTILAFSVTGMTLAVGLLAAHPVLPDATGPNGAVAQATAPAHAAPLIPLAALDLAAEAAPAGVPARDPRYTAALVDGESLERAVAATVGFVVAIASGATLGGPEAGTTGSGIEEAPATRTRRSGSVRSAIAVPYFSFARGTGRGGRS